MGAGPSNRTAPGSRRINDSPDQYREKVATPVPVGFRREWAPWVVNEDRTVLSFGWTDSEFDQAVFPEGTVWAEASHRTHSSDVGFLQDVTTLRGEYEIAPGYDFRAGS